MNVQALMTQGGIIQSMSQLGQDVGSAFREYNDIKMKREAAQVAKDQAADEMNFRRDALEAETTRQNSSQAFTGGQNQLSREADVTAASTAFGRSKTTAADRAKVEADAAEKARTGATTAQGTKIASEEKSAEADRANRVEVAKIAAIGKSTMAQKILEGYKKATTSLTGIIDPAVGERIAIASLAQADNEEDFNQVKKGVAPYLQDAQWGGGTGVSTIKDTSVAPPAAASDTSAVRAALIAKGKTPEQADAILAAAAAAKK